MAVRLKKTYSSREVAALTGLSARQLQWWDAHKLLTSTVASHRTDAGGFTERRSRARAKRPKKRAATTKTKAKAKTKTGAARPRNAKADA